MNAKNINRALNFLSTTSLTLKVIDVALLDSIRRVFPLKKVTHELIEIGLREDEAVELIRIHLRERGVI